MCLAALYHQPKRPFANVPQDREDEESNCHWCQIRSFPTHQTNPITVVNEVDSQIIPNSFRFIDSNALGQGVEPAEVSFRSGCACRHDSDCQYTGCLCLADLEDDYYEDDGMDIDEPNVSKKAYAYHARGSKAGLLRSQFHNSKVPIYECHQGCACSIDCPNRVVERGRNIPLQIFRTADRGWGASIPAATPTLRLKIANWFSTSPRRAVSRPY